MVFYDYIYDDTREVTVLTSRGVIKSTAKATDTYLFPAEVREFICNYCGSITRVSTHWEDHWHIEIGDCCCGHKVLIKVPSGDHYLKEFKTNFIMRVYNIMRSKWA